METKNERTHALYHALMRQLGFTREEQEYIILEISNGQTKSVKTLYAKFPRHYEVLVEKLKGMSDKCPELRSAQADRWRKRCIAAIAAWLDMTGETPEADRLGYIKGIACRTVGKEAGYFNRLTIPQLRTAYNSFVKQRQAYETAKGINDLFKTSKN